MSEQTMTSTAAVPREPTPVEPLRHTSQYTGEPGCIADARAETTRFLHRLRSEWCAEFDDRTAGDIQLVVSELVTNADRHSHGPYVLELEGTDARLTVAVYDSSSALPTVYAPDPTRIGGHGLEIVRALVSELHAEAVPVGKRVRAVIRFGG
ncbi:ATP-binding protein [Streptomyces sp. NPDC049954]|uniref:ATP-binding protein n=1 Tax=Streptomyces sp. NPDC049954 TaxID=3155779 RepID=UPI00341A8B51